MWAARVMMWSTKPYSSASGAGEIVATLAAHEAAA